MLILGHRFLTSGGYEGSSAQHMLHRVLLKVVQEKYRKFVAPFLPAEESGRSDRKLLTSHWDE